MLCQLFLKSEQGVALRSLSWRAGHITIAIAPACLSSGLALEGVCIALFLSAGSVPNGADQTEEGGVSLL